MEKSIRIRQGDTAPFRNLTCACVGTGRLDLALQEEYQNELSGVLSVCPFELIRGHGIFSDPMGIYQVREDTEGKHVSYCFTYLDRVFDSFLNKGIRPFLELSFMPEKMASGTQTLFYWKANVTPPAEMSEFTTLISKTLEHLIHRYGYQEVAGWPCEIWNEPNLTTFWENADQDAYLELYAAVSRTVKGIIPEMKVGGPVICGGSNALPWLDAFLSFCRKENLSLDFISRHVYMGQSPEKKGRYLYHRMNTVEDVIREIEGTREVIAHYDYAKHLPLYITEFNTSYNPFCPIHDTVENAAVMARLLSRLGDVCDLYSYWTFGDVFEEQGIPPRLFHGGFGLMAQGNIPKPTLFTFAVYAGLKGTPVYRDDHVLMTKRQDGGYEGILFQDGTEQITLHITVPVDKSFLVVFECVDELHGNPLRVWHQMGEPADLSQEQTEILRNAAVPLSGTVLPVMGKEGASFCITLKGQSVVHVRVLPVLPEYDEEYDYQYYCKEGKDNE